jgi:hypothetical protein
VLFSTSLFLVVAAGLAAATVGAIKANAVSRDASAATALAQDKIERFRALNPAVASDRAAMVSGSERVDALGQPGSKFQRTWTVRQGPRPGLAEVNVSVTWHGPGRHSITTSAYVCTSSTCT